MPAVIRTLRTARDTYKNTPTPADRAITADQWAKLDDTVPNALFNRLLKDANDVDLAMAAQAPMTNSLAVTAARLTMFVSHFHQVLDLGIARGTFSVGARSYYGRDINATAIPDLSTYDAVLEAADAIVSGEAARAAAEAGGVPTYGAGIQYGSGVRYSSGNEPPTPFVPMALPSAAEVAAVRDQFRTVRAQAQQAEAATNREQEELSAYYAEAQALAVDICDTVEFFYRKDPDASSRRAKCAAWGVVYIYDDGEQPPAPPAPAPAPPTP
jgi:hypothetical protein